MIYKQFKQENLPVKVSQSWTAGRRERKISQITVHHVTNIPETLFDLFNNPNRKASAHFYVEPHEVTQMIDTDDTSWTNGNWESNLRSITFETAGCWYDPPKIRNNEDRRLAREYQRTLPLRPLILEQMLLLFKAILKDHPDIRLTYHQDESNRATACPAELKHNGIAKEVFEKAKKELEDQNTKKVMMKPTTSFVGLFGAGGAIAHYLGVEPDVIINAIVTIGGSGVMTSLALEFMKNIKSVIGKGLCSKYPKQIFWFMCVVSGFITVEAHPTFSDIGIGHPMIHYGVVALASIVAGTLGYRAYENKLK